MLIDINIYIVDCVLVFVSHMYINYYWYLYTKSGSIAVITGIICALRIGTHITPTPTHSHGIDTMTQQIYDIMYPCSERHTRNIIIPVFRSLCRDDCIMYYVKHVQLFFVRGPLDITYDCRAVQLKRNTKQNKTNITI